jgi:hypothetical protein
MACSPKRRHLLGGAFGIAAGGLAAPRVLAQSDFMEPTRIRMGYAPYISAGPYFIDEAKPRSAPGCSTSWRAASASGCSWNAGGNRPAWARTPSW